MKRFLAMAFVLIMLTACTSVDIQVEDEETNAAPPAQQTEEKAPETPDEGKTEPKILEYERSETFQKLLGECNTAHEAVKISEADYMPYVVQYEEPGFDINKYRYDPAAQKPEDTVLTLEQVAEDMEVYYKALRTNYHCAYPYFGGDEAFRAAVDGVVADCAALEVITCGDVLDSMEERFAFVKDAHFSFGGRRSGELLVPFFFRSVAYMKTETGYETAEGKRVESVDGYEDLNELFKLSLTKEGELVYYPVVLGGIPINSFSGLVKCTLEPLTVHYTDGSTETLRGEDYYKPNFRGSTATVVVREEEDIPIVLATKFVDDASGQEFVRTAYDYRDRDIVILDLRYHSGGNVFVGQAWAEAYMRRTAFMHPVIAVKTGAQGNYSYYNSHRDNEFVSLENVRIVLTSKGACSAAEGFADICFNMENTLFVGENTFGAYTSSASNQISLPNSGLHMIFGNGLALFNDDGHFEEYRGLLPDIWVPAVEAEEAVMNFIAKNTTVK